MGTTSDKLNKLLETKQNIKQAIINKGVDVSDDDTFASYADRISDIPSGDNTVEILNMFTNDMTVGDYLFYKKYAHQDLLNKMDTKNMYSMYYMFHYCTNTAIDLTRFNTSSCISMVGMFAFANMKELDLNNFDTSNVTDMTKLFQNCNAEILKIDNFNTSKCSNMDYMFQYMNIKELDLKHFKVDPTNKPNIGYICNGMDNIEKIDCSTWDISYIGVSGMGVKYSFNSNRKLVDFYPPMNIPQEIQLDRDPLLSHDSLMRVINNLMEVSSTKNLKIGTTNIAKLTPEEIAIATNKGWTVL